MRGIALALTLAACGGSGNNNTDGGGGTCNAPNQMVNGYCLSPSGMAAARTQCGDVTEYCDKTGKPAPNLACLTNPMMPPAGPSTVTLTGWVHVFSNGPDSKGVSIQIFDAATLTGGADITTASPIATLAASSLDPATQRACDMDGAIGCTIPMAGGCTTPTCGANQYCKADGGQGTCSDRLRWEAKYSIPSIPTNKQLVIRTSGGGFQADATWANLVSWNVFFSTGDRACGGPLETDCLGAGGTYQYNINALSQADYANIPVVAGDSGGIIKGQGAVAGEVHDCDNIRVANVSVGVKPSFDRFTYFNGNPIKTVPDPSRTGTDRLGLFTALNVPPGKASVQAAASLDGTSPMVDFGAFNAVVYPDTVSVINVNGGRPKP